MLTIKAIRSPGELDSLAPFWDRLLSRSDMDMPYMTLDWFRMYWRLFETNSDMLVLVLSQDGEPAAIAPLMRVKAFWRGVPHTALTFIANFYSCRTGLINPLDRNILGPVFDFMKRSRIGFDMFYVNFIPEESRSCFWLRAFIAERKYAHREMDGDHSPYIPLPAAWDEFLGSKNKHFRDNLKRAIKTFETNADFSIKAYTRPDEFPLAWERLLEVSRKTWKYKQGSAIASTATVERFYRSFGEMAAKNGWFKILILEHKTQPIAFTYEFPYKKTLFFNKTGFDENFSRLSPGTYILSRSIRDAISGGFTEFDLLGRNEEYKMRFTSLLRIHRKFLIFNTNGMGKFLSRLELRMLPAAKSFAGRLHNPVPENGESPLRPPAVLPQPRPRVYALTGRERFVARLPPPASPHVLRIKELLRRLTEHTMR